MAATLRAAVELADARNARLTLVKTCEQGRAYVWVAPFAVGSAYLPAELESPEEAAQILARLATEVPASIPLTTLVLTRDTQTSLLKLLGQGHFGAIVADPDLLSHCRRLRRWLQREQIWSIAVEPASSEQSSSATVAARFSSNRPTEGVVDPEELSEGLRRRWSAGLRSWGNHHLAGAGGKH
jgi:hypothetical protein